MPKSVLDCFDVSPRLNKRGGVSMPQIVKAVFNPGFSAHLLPCLGKDVWVKQSTERGREDQAMIFIHTPYRQPKLSQFCSVASEHRDR